jgi:hypothetical protein
MLDTATAVYEAVEPIVIWRAMFAALQRSSDGEKEASLTCSISWGTRAYHHLQPLLSWVVTSLRQRDDEVLALHMPVVLLYILQRHAVSKTYRRRRN